MKHWSWIATTLWLGAAVLVIEVQAAQVCGNGAIEAPETCDDGNTVGGDACPSDCGVVPADPPALSVTDASVTEGDSGQTQLQFTVTRTGDTAEAINVGVTTADVGDAPATAGIDYAALLAGMRLVVPAGATSATVTVPLRPDADAEHDETLLVQLATAYQAGAISLLTLDALAADGPIAAVAVDLDGDRVADLATLNFDAKTISIRRNTPTTGALVFAAAVIAATGASPYALVAGDLDGDGRLDLVTVDRDVHTVLVLRNVGTTGAPALAAAVSLDVGGPVNSVAIGDIDRDGKPDLVTANFGAPGASVLLNASTPGTLAFAAAATFDTGHAHRAVAIADLDGDGRLDLALSGDAGVTQLRNTGSTGTVAFAEPFTLGAGLNPAGVVAVDFDGDGKPDSATANYNGDTVSVIHNRSSPGGLGAVGQVTFAVGDQPFDLVAGDVDGDGKVDLVVTNRAANTISVLRNKSVLNWPDFETQKVYATRNLPYHPALADFDGDGPVDIAVPNYFDDAVSLFRNDRPIVPITTNEAVGTILNDDEPVVAFGAAAGTIDESDGTTTVTVTLTGVAEETVEVTYALGGTATQIVDYTISPASLSFAPGETSKTLTIAGLDDAADDATASETVVITLADPANAVLGLAEYALTIENDAGAPAAPPATPTPPAPEAAVGGGGALGYGLLVLLAATGLARRIRRHRR